MATDPVSDVLTELVPASYLKNITSFVFFDGHPSDEANIDVTICTTMGEVMEFHQRELQSSVHLGSDMYKPSQITLMRNEKCELFYIVFASDKIAILSRKDKLVIHRIVSNVDRYDISDDECTGQAILKIYRLDDAIPMTFDDNFDSLMENVLPVRTTESTDEALPLLTHLQRKLVEARYSVKCNEKAYKDLLNMHQAVAFSSYKRIHPNLDDSVFKDGWEDKIGCALKINREAPWIKVCNKKIAIVYSVLNLNYKPLEDVHVLLHGTSQSCIEYTIKLFESIEVPPFWVEKQSHNLQYNVKTAIVVVIDLEEIKHNVSSRIDLNGVLFYKQAGKECLLPIEDVKISTLDTMGEEFDVFSSNPLDSNILLAVLATSDKTCLMMHHIKEENDEEISSEIFCKYLHMEKLPNTENIVIHRKSPFHVLHGVMIILQNLHDGIHYPISVYSRTPSQVLALIHHVYDAVPPTLIITANHHKITSKDPNLLQYNEDTLENTQPVYNYDRYITSILDRSKLVLEYLNYSISKMRESKDPAVQSRVLSEIDLFAGGAERYSEFKRKMREATNGLEISTECVTANNSMS